MRTVRDVTNVVFPDDGTLNEALVSLNSSDKTHRTSEKHKDGAVKSRLSWSVKTDPKYARLGIEVELTEGKAEIRMLL